MSEASFQLWKGAAVLLALAVATTWQRLRPYRGDRAAVLGNWRVNVPLALFNAVLVGLVCNGCACAVALWAREAGFGLLNLASLPEAARVGVAVVALDLTAYAWHRANHRLPFLWRFHAVHHSDEVFDASTAVRFHPGEILISLVVRLAVVAALGLSVVGILAFEMIYAALNFFEHGDIRLPLGLERRLDRIFVTPALHRKHHTSDPTGVDRNFGTIFSTWDRLLRTHATATSEERITVGLPGAPTRTRGVLGLLSQPLSDGKMPN